MFLLSFFSFLLIPFTFTFRTLDPTLHLRFVSWSFLTLVLAIVLFSKDETVQETTFFSMTNRLIFWNGGAFLLVAAFSLSCSMNMGEAIFCWLTLFLPGSFLFICSLLFCRHPHYFTTINHWAVTAAVGLVILALTGHYWHNDAAIGQDFFFRGIMVNKNLYASSLFLLLPFVVHCLTSSQKRWRRTTMLLLPVLCFVILLSQSRAVWLAMFFSTIPVVILARHFPAEKYQKNLAVKAVTKSISVLSVSIFLAVIWLLIVAPATINNIDTVRLRSQLWMNSVQMIQDELFLGVGPGQWRLLLPKYDMNPLWNADHTEMIETRAQRPHNDLLWITAETGFIGGICYLLFFAVLYYYAVKILKKAGDEQKALTLSMLYGINGYLVIAMFSYPRERPLHGLLLMLMAATVVASYHRLYPTTARKKTLYTPIVKWTMLTVLTVCCLNSGLRLYSETKLKSALAAREKGQWQQVVSEIDKVFLPAYSIDPFAVPLTWYRGMAQYHLGKAPAALDDFRRAITYHPYHGHSLNNVHILEKLTDAENR